MARYTGPKTKIARRFGEAIFGADKSLEKKKLSVQVNTETHEEDQSKSEYAVQLTRESKRQNIHTEFLEKQFRNLYTRKHLQKPV